MLPISLTPRVLFDALFILGSLLAAGYALEFIRCAAVKGRCRRVFNKLMSIWFVVTGIYIFFAFSYGVGVFAIVCGFAAYYWDKLLVNKLFKKL
jgi:hypothetical protein